MKAVRKENLWKDFQSLRESLQGEKQVLDSLSEYEKDSQSYLRPWYEFSKTSQDVYPSQVLLETPFDHLKYKSVQMLPQELMIKTLRMRHFFLKLFNHPLRIHALEQKNKKNSILLLG